MRSFSVGVDVNVVRRSKTLINMKFHWTALFPMHHYHGLPHLFVILRCRCDRVNFGSSSCGQCFQGCTRQPGTRAAEWCPRVGGYSGSSTSLSCPKPHALGIACAREVSGYSSLYDAMCYLETFGSGLFCVLLDLPPFVMQLLNITMPILGPIHVR